MPGVYTARHQRHRSLWTFCKLLGYLRDSVGVDRCFVKCYGMGFTAPKPDFAVLSIETPKAMRTRRRPAGDILLSSLSALWAWETHEVFSNLFTKSTAQAAPPLGHQELPVRLTESRIAADNAVYRTVPAQSNLLKPSRKNQPLVV